jgi:hypothetical protein
MATAIVLLCSLNKCDWGWYQWEEMCKLAQDSMASPRRHSPKLVVYQQILAFVFHQVDKDPLVFLPQDGRTATSAKATTLTHSQEPLRHFNSTPRRTKNKYAFNIVVMSFGLPWRRVITYK